MRALSQRLLERAPATCRRRFVVQQSRLAALHSAPAAMKKQAELTTQDGVLELAGATPIWIWAQP